MKKKLVFPTIFLSVFFISGMQQEEVLEACKQVLATRKTLNAEERVPYRQKDLEIIVESEMALIANQRAISRQKSLEELVESEKVTDNLCEQLKAFVSRFSSAKEVKK